jgi:transposase, IS5 family
MEAEMYRRPSSQMVIEDFVLPFEGKLNADNRWVKLAQIIPWKEIEKKYAKLFPSNTGTVAKPLRMALGALIIKEKCSFTDRETVDQITENPYLQYFIGLEKYQLEPPFDPSLMVYFRKRLDQNIMEEINEMVCPKENLPKDHGHGGSPNAGGTPPERQLEPAEQVHKGKLLLDATCAPADIRYPTDLSLLNEAREKTEKMIDTLYNASLGLQRKPRTYRKKARQEYLKIAKQRKPKGKAIRKAIGKQLGYLGRNLKTIDSLLNLTGHSTLSANQTRELATIQTLYGQQREMYAKKIHQISDRIVSISQPHVRPIVRGKAKAKTEFGAKVAVSMVDGYIFIDELSWDSFNESVNLKQSVEDYKKRYGYYPEAVLADQIYRNRDNRRFCKTHGIRLSGPPLGRPALEAERENRKLELQDMKDRNAVEGGFGVGKRKFGLDRIMARLKETAESVIALQFIIMNLEHRLRVLFYRFLHTVLQRHMGQNLAADKLFYSFKCYIELYMSRIVLT